MPTALGIHWNPQLSFLRCAGAVTLDVQRDFLGKALTGQFLPSPLWDVGRFWLVTGHQRAMPQSTGVENTLLGSVTSHLGTFLLCPRPIPLLKSSPITYKYLLRGPGFFCPFLSL